MSHPVEPDETPEGQTPPSSDRFRALAERVVGIAGGIPAVRTLMAVFAVYDRAGGGLVAGGLAYAALIALVPGALLVASAVGYLVDDPAMQDLIVEAVANAVPPLEDIARTAIESVAAGAVPTTIIALLGLLWGSSRFYASLDYAFSRVFHSARRRNEVERTLRGVVVTFLFVGLPIAALLAASIASWLLDFAPDQERVEGLPEHSCSWRRRSAPSCCSWPPCRWSTATCPRSECRPGRSCGPRSSWASRSPRSPSCSRSSRRGCSDGWRSTARFVAVFALLAWLSIGFNLLLLGAAWTRVRAPRATGRQAADDRGSGPGTGA